LNATGSPHFLPGMSGARVNNQALRQISKNAGSSLIRFEKSFLDAPVPRSAMPAKFLPRSMRRPA